MADRSTSPKGDGAVKRMLDTAGQVADFAYKQGVADAVAVDHLIKAYRAKRAAVERLEEELRIARFDADVPLRELREENERLRARLERYREAHGA